MALDVGRIEETIDKLRKLLKKAPARPSPEQVHDLRTHTRRFEAITQALSINSRRNERLLLRGLARLRKRAGKVRDMDVLTGYTAAVHVRNEQDCLTELLEYLGAERYRHAKKLHAAMQRDGGALRKRLKCTSRRVEKRLSGARSSGDDGQSTVPTDAMASALRLSGELTTPRHLGRRSLHPYRLKVKELRNVLQAADSEDHPFVAALGEIKDAIGEWHDWEELIGIAADVLDHGAHCGLVREFRHIGSRKFER